MAGAGRLRQAEDRAQGRAYYARCKCSLRQVPLHRTVYYISWQSTTKATRVTAAVHMVYICPMGRILVGLIGNGS